MTTESQLREIAEPQSKGPSKSDQLFRKLRFLLLVVASWLVGNVIAIAIHKPGYVDFIRHRDVYEQLVVKATRSFHSESPPVQTIDGYDCSYSTGPDSDQWHVIIWISGSPNTYRTGYIYSNKPTFSNLEERRSMTKVSDQWWTFENDGSTR